MNSKIDIDDLFRDGLHKAEEVMPSAAWSNMNMMLDGKNPYSEDEKKRRPLGWFFGLLLAGLLAIVGTYAWLNSGTANKSLTATPGTPPAQALKPTSATDIELPADFNVQQSTGENAALLTSKAAADSDGVPSSQDFVSAPTSKAENLANRSAFSAPTASTEPSSETTTNTSAITPSTVPATTQQGTLSAELTTNTSTQVTKTQSRDEATSKLATPIRPSKSLVGTAMPEPIVSAKSVRPVVVAKESATSSNQPRSSTSYDTYNKPVESASPSVATVSATPRADDVAKASTNYSPAGKSTTIVALTDTKDRAGKKVTKTDTIAHITSANSSPVAKIDDNPSVNAEVKVTDVVLPPKSNDTQGETQNKSLTGKSKRNRSIAAAKKSGVKQVVDNTEPQPLPNVKTDVAGTHGEKSLMSTTTQKAAQSAPTPSTNKPRSAADATVRHRMLDAIESAKQKGIIQVGTLRMKVDPIVLAGLNAQIRNNKNDLGGFHAGMSFAIQLSKKFQITPHALFFYKNNGGYTINDTSTIITNRTGPAAAGSNSSYSYDLATTSVAHNFKRATSVEAPVVLQYKIGRSLSVYGGANFAYGMRYNTQDFYKVSNSTVTDLVPANQTYTFPSDRNTVYKSPDFNARFGIGYIGGMQLMATRNLAIDLRIAQNTWDNSSTSSGQIISKNVFKVPSVQLSFGYKIKDEERDQ
jgi:hypothetical protein